MTNKKRTLDEPEIRQLLTGLVRCDKRYYRPDPTTGFHTPVAARAELMKLTSQVTATRLLREALAAGIISEEKIDLAQESHGRAVEKEADLVANATDDDTEDEPDEKQLSPYYEKQKQRARARFHLVKRVSRYGTYYGIFDADRQQEELISTDRGEALQEIARRIGEEEMDHVPYYLQFRTGLAA